MVQGQLQNPDISEYEKQSLLSAF